MEIKNWNELQKFQSVNQKSTLNLMNKFTYTVMIDGNLDELHANSRRSLVYLYHGIHAMRYCHEWLKFWWKNTELLIVFTTFYIYNDQYFYQGMTNNVWFAFCVGDTTRVVYDYSIEQDKQNWWQYLMLCF